MAKKRKTRAQKIVSQSRVRIKRLEKLIVDTDKQIENKRDKIENVSKENNEGSVKGIINIDYSGVEIATIIKMVSEREIEKYKRIIRNKGRINI